MKIMSFNTQHCLNFKERTIDFKIMAETILAEDADVIGLNEMRGAGEHPDYTDQTRALSELTGITDYYFAKALDVPGGGPYGNALLSKIPIVEARTIPIPMPTVFAEDETRHREPRCVLKAKLENGVTVLVAHFGLNPSEQRSAVQTVLENFEDEKCILMGDFNLRPDNPILSDLRERMQDAADCFAEPYLSFPSDAPYAKIDYIFTSRDMKITHADIPAVIASDHRPHTATVTF